MGFDARFLGVVAAMPRVDDSRVASGVARETTVELDYVHFSVVLDTARRLAAVTGVNIDGASLIELERGDDWRFDERIPVDWQAGPAIYARNDFDRGHLVRRRDPVWGEPAVAVRANSDTFHYTNAAPQAAGFNQSKELWLGLEDHVLSHAAAHGQRLSVFTAPVLGEADPPYRGIQVPWQFWKIAAWNTGTDGRALASVGFILDQTPLIDTSELPESAAGEAPPVGPFRTFQVPVDDIAAITGLIMPELVAADRMPATVAAAGWRALETSDQILL